MSHFNLHFPFNNFTNNNKKQQYIPADIAKYFFLYFYFNSIVFYFNRNLSYHTRFAYSSSNPLSISSTFDSSFCPLH